MLGKLAMEAEASGTAAVSRRADFATARASRDDGEEEACRRDEWDVAAEALQELEAGMAVASRGLDGDDARARLGLKGVQGVVAE
jgi:hypothetical protein